MVCDSWLAMNHDPPWTKQKTELVSGLVFWFMPGGEWPTPVVPAASLLLSLTEPQTSPVGRFFCYVVRFVPISSHAFLEDPAAHSVCWKLGEMHVGSQWRKNCSCTFPVPWWLTCRNMDCRVSTWESLGQTGTVFNMTFLFSSSSSLSFLVPLPTKGRRMKGYGEDKGSSPHLDYMKQEEDTWKTEGK